MDFWFYSQSYIGNNFNSFELLWDKHIKMRILFASNQYQGYCYPVIDMNNPSLDPAPAIFNFPQTSGWIYFVCGVDTLRSKFFSTYGQTLPEISYISTVTIPTTSVSLRITENSLTGYGLTYVREIRLWSCYNCSFSLGFM